MTKKEIEELENQILTYLNKKHVKEITLDQYMRERKIDQKPKEKYKLIGALKDFQKIKRSYVLQEKEMKRGYVLQGKKCLLMLQIV